MKTVLVLGGTGFIGSHVVEALRNAGCEVRCPVRPKVRFMANSTFLEGLGVELVEFENYTSPGLMTLMKNIDVVYNCIADVRLNQSLDEYRKTQVELTRTLAIASAKQPGIRFVQLSTIEVYGETPETVISEDYPCKPVFEFQQSVYEREQVLEQVSKETGLEYVIARPASTFGRRYRLMKFMLDAHQKGRFPLIGDGQHKMSMVDTRDIGRAMVLLGSHPGAVNHVFHICGYEASMMDLKKAIDDISGRATKVQKLPIPIAKFVARCMELFTPKSKVPTLSRFAVHSITSHNRFDASRIGNLGFVAKFSLMDTVENILSHVSDDHGLNKERIVGRANLHRRALP